MHSTKQYLIRDYDWSTSYQIYERTIDVDNAKGKIVEQPTFILSYI